MPFDLAPTKPFTREQERCLELADWIEQHPEQFDMNTFHDERSCGTVGCVGGWAAVLYWDEIKGGMPKETLLSRQGAYVLGLEAPETDSGLLPITCEAARMFLPRRKLGCGMDQEKIFAPHAVAMLRRFVASGDKRVIWFDPADG